MLLRLQKFDYSIEYKKDTEMYFADSDSVKEIMHDIHSVNHRTYSDERYLQIKEATENDESLQLLKKIILEGWPDFLKDVHSDVPVCFPFREEFVVQNGIIYKAERVVEPKSITHSIVQRIYNSCFGVQGCIRRAQDYVYWPNMSKDIESYIGFNVLHAIHTRMTSRRNL